MLCSLYLGKHPRLPTLDKARFPETGGPDFIICAVGYANDQLMGIYLPPADPKPEASEPLDPIIQAEI